MSKRDLTITLRAKNALRRGLGRARKALSSFGKSARRIGGMFAKGFLIAGAAIAGFAAKALGAYAEQEKAERSLVAAMNAHGEAGEKLLPTLKKQASAIQDETAAADEATLASMAKMRMLGVQVNKLEEAAKAEQALAAIGLKGESAQRAVALAMQGNYDMLQRYIPAIRNANNEQEKAAAFNSLVAKGYEQQKQQLDTVSGRWKELKGRIGDVWEQMGKTIEQSSGLSSMVATASEEIKAFGVSVKKWMDTGGIINLIATVKMFGAEAAKNFSLVGNTAGIVWAAISDGVDTAINYVKGVVGAWVQLTIADFNLLKDRAVAIWEKIKHPFSKMPEVDTSEYEKAVRDLADKIKGEEAVVTKRTEEQLAKREDIYAKYAERVKAISEDQTSKLIDDANKEKEEIVDLEKAKTAAVKKNVQQQLKIQKDVQNAEQEARKKELAGVKDARKQLEKQANMRVQDFIEQQKEAEAAAEARQAEKDKREKLEAKVDRGIKLSRKDREWLDAAKAIEQAGQGAKVLRGREAEMEKQIKAAQEQLTELKKMSGNIKDIREDNKKLLTF